MERIWQNNSGKSKVKSLEVYLNCIYVLLFCKMLTVMYTKNTECHRKTNSYQTELLNEPTASPLKTIICETFGDKRKPHTYTTPPRQSNDP